MTAMKHDDRLNSIIARLVGSEDAHDIRAAYRDWAESYDADLDSFGYVAPRIGVELFHAGLGNSAGMIFDAGCGTGRCGEILVDRGYTRIHGADFSAEMLAEARKGGHYEQLSEVDFRSPLSIADKTYDGALSIGVYSTFIGAGFASELVRITKPGGIVCMSCRFNYYAHDLEPHLAMLEAERKITIESAEPQPYMTGQDADAVYVVARVL